MHKYRRGASAEATLSALSVWSSLLVFGYVANSAAPPPRQPTPHEVVEGRNQTSAQFSRAAANNELAIRRHERFGVRHK
jgi:hypothetical protein